VADNRVKWVGSGEVPGGITKAFTWYFLVMFALGIVTAVGLLIAYA
jgi:hypothetical protein